MITISFVATIALISNSNEGYAQQQENKTMTKDDKSHKYFAIQETKTSYPDNLAPGHGQFHQIVVFLHPKPDKIYVGEVSYTASSPVNVFVMQPLNTTVIQNATSVPLANIEGEFAVSGSHILNAEVADNVDFAGSAVYFHSRSSEPFTVAYTAVGKTVESTPVYK
jgi:hypothetical protein